MGEDEAVITAMTAGVEGVWFEAAREMERRGVIPHPHDSACEGVYGYGAEGRYEFCEWYRCFFINNAWERLSW